MTDPLTPNRGDKFTFGLWTVGSAGRDPFDCKALARYALKYERLDQLTIEVLFGVRQ